MSWPHIPREQRTTNVSAEEDAWYHELGILIFMYDLANSVTSNNRNELDDGVCFFWLGHDMGCDIRVYTYQHIAPQCVLVFLLCRDVNDFWMRYHYCFRYWLINNQDVCREYLFLERQMNWGIDFFFVLFRDPEPTLNMWQKSREFL